MIFSEVLLKHDGELSECLDELFSSAYKNQAYPTDLLLVVTHGYFDESIKQAFPNVTGFMIGAGKNHEEFTERTQYNFYNQYRKNHLDCAFELSEGINSYDDFIGKIQEDKELKKFEISSVDLELIIYQKIWETDLLLKRVGQLIRLAQGKDYEWNFKIRDSGNFIKNKILSESKNKLPKLYNFINGNYSKELRNAIAHSQYYLASRRIHVHKPPFSLNLTFEDWSIIFHKLLLFYNHYIKELKKYDDIYIKSYAAKRTLNIKIPETLNQNEKLKHKLISVEYFERGQRWTFKQN